MNKPSYHDAEQTLERLAQLPNNWNSYGSAPIQACALESAQRLLHLIQAGGYPVPRHIGPVSGGGLQFDWYERGRELELEVLPDGSLQYLRVTDDDEMEEGVAPSAEDPGIRESLAWFARVIGGPTG